MTLLDSYLQKTFTENSMTKGACLTICTLLLSSTLAFAASTAGAGKSASPASDLSPAQIELQAARNAVRENPSDGKAHFALGELLRKSGRHNEAAEEYVKAAQLDPTMYVALHQLSTVTSDPGQLDEGIALLKKLKETRPNELMLCVALSELMEKRGEFYQASRLLVDLVYKDAVPVKYQAKVNARIHYLLTKAKDAKNVVTTVSSDEDLDVLPPPLPDSYLRSDLASSKLREAKAAPGVGHNPLLP